MKLPDWLTSPNISPVGVVMAVIVVVEIVLGLFLWAVSENPIIPHPSDVLHAYPGLLQKGLGYHLIVSTKLFAQALLLAMVISLSLSYFSRLAVGQPISALVGKLRFLGLTGLAFLFQMTFGSGHTLKLSLLTFSITVFYTVGMMEVVRVSQEKLDHARTLKMSEWHILWEVIIRGTFDQALELLRQNAAMGWMMMTVVEGLERSEGGVGTLLLNSDKTFNLPEIFALQFMILLVGIGVDYGLGQIKRGLCPHVVFVSGGK